MESETTANIRTYIIRETLWRGKYIGRKVFRAGRKSAILRTLLPRLLILNVILMAWASTVYARPLLPGGRVPQKSHKSRKTNSIFRTLAEV